MQSLKIEQNHHFHNKNLENEIKTVSSGNSPEERYGSMGIRTPVTGSEGR